MTRASTHSVELFSASRRAASSSSKSGSVSSGSSVSALAMTLSPLPCGRRISTRISDLPARGSSSNNRWIASPHSISSPRLGCSRTASSACAMAGVFKRSQKICSRSDCCRGVMATNAEAISASGSPLSGFTSDDSRAGRSNHTVERWLKDFKDRIPTPFSMLEKMKAQGSVSTTNESDIWLLLAGKTGRESGKERPIHQHSWSVGAATPEFRLPLLRFQRDAVKLLREVNLSSSNLDHANFGVIGGSWAARTQDQPLKGADLTGAILTDCDFRYAKCEYAIFRHAALAGADFLGASPGEANFEGCDLRGANFE